MAPAAFSLATAGASRIGTWPASSTAPPVDRIPSVSMASLMVTGSPCSGPIASPRAVASSAAAPALRGLAPDPGLTAVIGEHVGGQLAREPAGGDGVDAHPAPRPLGSQLAGEVDEPSLAGGVAGLGYLSGTDHAQHRRHVDDAPAPGRQHVPGGQLGQHE